MQGIELLGKKKDRRGTADQEETEEGEDEIEIEMDIDGGTGVDHGAKVARGKGRDIGTDGIATRVNGGGIAKAALLVPDVIAIGETMTTKTAEGKGGVTDIGESIESVIGPGKMSRRGGGEGGARVLVGQEALDPRREEIIGAIGNSFHF